MPNDTDEGNTPERHVSAVLQDIHRPTEVTISHLQALGVHVIPDAAPADVIGDTSVLPDFAVWDRLNPDEAHAANESAKQPLNNGNLSPGCLVYLDRKRELSIPNEAAYRAVRRIQPPPGQSQARLGNSYEFYRCLEMFSAYWDDTSRPNHPAKTNTSTTDDGSEGEPGTAPGTRDSPEKAAEAPVTHRTASGTQMPPDCRQNIISSFLKLVAYDFGCNISAPRTEPRLYLSSPASPPIPARTSYFSSGCTFIFRTPTTREAARAGIVEGPLAAVSARHTTSFTPPSASASQPTKEATMDLARELIAALLTAQHRRRAGKTERRIGEDAWWATKPRWGGGPGGPIGREIEMLNSGADAVVVGDKDAPGSRPEDSPMAAASSLSSPYPSGGGNDGVGRARALPSRLAGGSAGVEAKGAKRLKKSGNGSTLPMYDNYRMVRPPSAAWDRKTRYEAIGRKQGVDYDDVFVVSSLFHHVSVLRVRVPDRLMEVLEGDVDDGGEDGTGRSWGRLEVWRSKWYDFFLVEERVEAMQLVWGMMACLMRKEEEGNDVNMGMLDCLSVGQTAGFVRSAGGFT